MTSSTSEVDLDPNAMVAAARSAVDEARRRAEDAAQIVTAVIGASAFALREQGLSDRQIAAALEVSRNRLDTLISSAWGIIFGTDVADAIENADRWKSRWLTEILGSAANNGPSPWRQAPSQLSSDLVAANTIALPAGIEVGRLDTPAAQFDNTATGERVLVYTLERWNGTLVVNSVTGEIVGTDGKGMYRVELRALNGARCELSPELVELDPNTVYFGEGWDDPARNRSCDAACEAIQAAIRRHYRIWPNWTEVTAL